MGSVPNCRKEIPTRHAIRWFKCKLKPPKNQFSLDLERTESETISWDLSGMHIDGHSNEQQSAMATVEDK